MSSAEPSSSDDLLERAARGDAVARDELFTHHRERLRRMVAVRLDPRLAARVDPSDVVQETLAEAAGKLDAYLGQPPLPFYPWLRRIAWEKLVDLHRYHLQARRRSVLREWTLSNQSAVDLADRLLGREASPSDQFIRAEQRARLRAGLDALPVRDRDVLVMRHLEQLTIGEIADILQIGEGAVKMRLLRAIERLRILMADPNEEPEP